MAVRRSRGSSKGHGHHESEFRGGLRVTTPEMVRIVRMVLTGDVNADIVNMLNDHGSFAIGLSGEDASLLTADSGVATVVDGEHVDIGQVGGTSSR